MKEVKIAGCIYRCPFYGSSPDGMECDHPFFKDKRAYDNMIITQDNGRDGKIPPKCPLRKKPLILKSTYSLQEEETKHTPGPWRFNTFTEHPSKNGGYFIYSGKTLATLFNSGKNSTYSVASGECRANARLMAAAPRLLGACKKALSCLAYRADNGDKEALVSAILLEQAIKEAEEE